MKVEGKRTKPMVDGMYTRHPQYTKSPLDEAQKRALQHRQGIRCAQKRETRKHAERILAGR